MHVLETVAQRPDQVITNLLSVSHFDAQDLKSPPFVAQNVEHQEWQTLCENSIGVKRTKTILFLLFKSRHPLKYVLRLKVKRLDMLAMYPTFRDAQDAVVALCATAPPGAQSGCFQGGSAVDHSMIVKLGNQKTNP